MKTITIVGIILIVLGLISLAYQGITYTKERSVIDLGPIRATVEEKKQVPLPPVLGGIAVAGGIILLLMGAKRRA